MSTLMDGDRKVTDDIEKASLLNRTFAAKFVDPQVTVYPQTVDYPIDSLTTFDVCSDTVKAVLKSVNRCEPKSVNRRRVTVYVQ